MKQVLRRCLKWSIIIFSFVACFFLLKWGLKTWEAHSERLLARDMAKFDPFGPSPHTVAILLDEKTWYFPTHEVDVQELPRKHSDNKLLDTTVTAEAIFTGCFENQNKMTREPYRFVVYRYDLHGENQTEVFSIEGKFYNCSKGNTRDTFIFSYNKEKNNDNTRCVFLYDITTDEVSMVSTGAEVTLRDVINQQMELEKEEDVWAVTWQKDTITMTSDTAIVTIPQKFWSGTEFEATFPDETANKITAYPQEDIVALTAWFDYPLAGSMAVTFSYDPATQQLEFLSCVNPYDFEGVRTVLILD